uniref:M23 family metallopeptidase n=1 Tax=Streptomyces polyasparticus TaxID=2767826 RepID=UPI003F683915
MAAVSAAVLLGVGAQPSAAEPAPAHAGWDGSKYWYKDASGWWRWTQHYDKYLRHAGHSSVGKSPAPPRTGEPTFNGTAGWDAVDHVYWFKSQGHWYWTSHRSTYEQRTGGSVASAGGKAASRPSASRGWTAPVSGYVLTGHYRQHGNWSRGYHTGTDFAVPTGTDVRSVGPGRVIAADYNRAFGYEIVVRHPDGRFSQYAHLSRIQVSVGQAVGTGQQVARSGATGNVTGPHLHFEVRNSPYFGSDIDPITYLRAKGVRV